MDLEIQNKREQEILDSIIKILNKDLNPGRIILFGSRAKKKYPGNADFDIAIDGEKPDLRKQRKINEEIDRIAGLYKVDIVYLKSVKKEFKNIIVKTGKTIYEK